MNQLKAVFCSAVLAIPGIVADVHAEEADMAAPKPESCISLSRIRSSEVIDRSHMVFTMSNGSLYLNTLPYPCPGLSRHTAYLHRTSLNQICDLDIITVLNPGGGGFMPGASCGLGKFVPIVKEDVIVLKQQLEAAAKP